MALHSTGKQAHFPNYNNSLYNRERIGPKCLNLQYEAWTLKKAANLLPKLKPLLHINIIRDMWPQAINPFIKNIRLILWQFWGHVSMHYLLFGNAVRNYFASGWFGLWNVGWDPLKWENNNNMLQASAWELCYEKIKSESVYKNFTLEFFYGYETEKPRNQKSQRL